MLQITMGVMVGSVVRLCLSLELGAAEPVLQGIVSKASAEDLMALRTALQGRLDEMLPMQTQLGQVHSDRQTVDKGFLI